MLLRLLKLQFIFFLVACHAEINVPTPKTGEITLPSGEKIEIELSIEDADQSRGLSGRKQETFSKSKGMLFCYPKLGPRQFWMPDTYFNLDIFFLDETLKVTNIARNLKAHPGRDEPPAIEITEIYPAKFVLEMRSDSPIAKKIKKGTILKWTGPSSLLGKE